MHFILYGPPSLRKRSGLSVHVYTINNKPATRYCPYFVKKKLFQSFEYDSNNSKREDIVE